MTTSKNVLKNSTAAIVVDFNKEMTGIVNGNSNAQGRELKLACAIYSAQETFRIADLLESKKTNGKSKRERQIAAASTSEAFAGIAKEYDKAKIAAKSKGLAGFDAKERMKAATKLQAAALQMFERALYGAYFMLSGGAVIESQPTATVVKLRFTRAVDTAGVKYANGHVDNFSRADCYSEGKKLATARGMVAVVASTKGKSGAGIDTKQTASVTTAFAEVSKAIGALADKSADDFRSSAGTDTAFGTIIRKMFVADGKLSIVELVEHLRSNEALKGVQIVNGTVEAPSRKPRNVKPVAVAA